MNRKGKEDGILLKGTTVRNYECKVEICFRASQGPLTVVSFQIDVTV